MAGLLKGGYGPSAVPPLKGGNVLEIASEIGFRLSPVILQGGVRRKTKTKSKRRKGRKYKTKTKGRKYKTKTRKYKTKTKGRKYKTKTKGTKYKKGRKTKSKSKRK